MARNLFPASLEALIESFERLPGIGRKTAQKLAFHMLGAPQAEAAAFAKALIESHEKIHRCESCFNWAEGKYCGICEDDRRDKTILCVVEDPRYLIAIERTGEYHGLYHVLHGLISPMDGIGPDDLTIDALLAHVSKGVVKEVVVATNANVEGEATALYLGKILSPLGVKTTRLAYGIPVGGDLEYADEITLFRAFEGRNEI